ncbi:MAG: tRNA preQ1(34) S-adenosylmethionine ribosyltransferase-isomerase QueA [Clostridia bacterium]|nr:tRNA preQ1(34) S-adenosylmethionine ribosyltransferase-isomerase QueA [Clostridia bacterium]
MNEDYTKKSTYYYNLPEELIAQVPLEKRDNSRMLVYSKKTGEIFHKHFYDIVDYFKPGDVLVLNNSRVLPARLFGIKEETGARIEVLLQKRINLTTWEVIVKPQKRLKIGSKIKFSNELSCEVKELKEYGVATVEFIFSGRFEEILDRIGLMPLPPYIKEKLKDKERYQTVYSKQLGSSAAPTAGLHFTPELLQKLRDKGVQVVEVMLHVGLGTFRPVKEDDITKHEMHSEFYSISEDAAKVINLAKKEHRRVIACGTTSMRTLESAAQKFDDYFGVRAESKNTSIFIYPPYNFKIVDALITNFHLPESTLLMLISAFIGLDNVKNIYNIAIEEKYRFFSFGDCCLFI